MSTSTLFPSAFRSKISAIALFAALLFGFVDSAHAVINVGPPAGWTGGRVHVGREINGTMWAVYFTGYTGGTYTCAGSYQIGTNNVLNNSGERHRIHGGSGDDEMLLVGGLITSSNVCGKALIEFVNMPKVELWGDGGNDWIHATVHNESALMSGGAGDDSMIVGQLAQARGGDGADWIDSAYAIELYGENGGDLFCSHNVSPAAAATLIDGGAGTTDQCWALAGNYTISGCGVSVTGVEYLGDQVTCDNVRQTIIDRFHD